jgi:hypothetical protein
MMDGGLMSEELIRIGWDIPLGSFSCPTQAIFTHSLLQIAIHLQQMGKIGPFGKSRKVFWHIQKGPKTQERRAFENLSVHFECAENLSSIPKRTECCK